MNKDNNNCDCFIGFLCGEQTNLSNLNEKIKDILYLEPLYYAYKLTDKLPLITIKQIVDNRRGYLSRFKFCPYCGKILEWKKIINDL